MKHYPEYLPIQCAGCGSRERFDVSGTDAESETVWYVCPNCEDYEVSLEL